MALDMTDIKIRIRAWLDDDGVSHAMAPVTPLRGPKRAATSDEVGDMLEGARRREDPLWGEMEGLLLRLDSRYPLRCRRIRRELKWLRRRAYRADLPWGKR